MKRFKQSVLLGLMMVFAIGLCSWANPGTDLSPVLNEGKKWRIGYCESEPFVNYAFTLHALLEGLGALGWMTGIPEMPFQEGQGDTSRMWEWLATHDIGPSLECVPDAHYTLSELTPDAQATILTRLQDGKDIDLLLVMGTRAGLLITKKEPPVSTLVFSTSNAVLAGIVQAVDRSGHQNVWAHMDPDRFRRQVEVFFDLFHFQKMGMVYEDSTVGRTYAAVTDVEAVAKERGFWVVRRLVDEPKSPDDRERYYQEVLKAHRELALEVDAMFLTVASLDVTWLPELLAPFYEKKIPVFSQLGTEEVKNGALLSVSHSDFREMGRFGAETMVRVLRGTPPEDLEQVFVDTPHIALNFDVADQIGYKIPFDILLVADEIFLWKTHPESTGSNEK